MGQPTAFTRVDELSAVIGPVYIDAVDQLLGSVVHLAEADDSLLSCYGVKTLKSPWGRAWLKATVLFVVAHGREDLIVTDVQDGVADPSKLIFAVGASSASIVSNTFLTFARWLVSCSIIADFAAALVQRVDDAAVFTA